jgi:hypothetical protein
LAAEHDHLPYSVSSAAPPTTPANSALAVRVHVRGTSG